MFSMKNNFPLTTHELITLAGFSSLIYSILKEATGSLEWSAGISIFLFVVALVLWSIARFWQSTESRYKIISSMDVQETRKDIIDVERSILVTHFSRNIPSEEYVALMVGKLNQGVVITRVVPETINNEDKQISWLKEFRDSPHYVEKVTEGVFLPFDVVIYDDKKVKIVFPVSADIDHYSQGIAFNNSKVAAMFRIALERVNNNKS